MDNRMQKDEHFVDMIGVYHFAFAVFGLCILPIELLQGIAIIAIVIYAFYIYAKRRKIKKAPVPSELKLSHINLLITNFWRFNYLFLVPFIMGLTVMALYGDHTKWNEFQAQLMQGNTDMSYMEGLLDEYKSDNFNLKLICNLIFYQPLIWYILFKTYKGYKAFKNNEIVDPKSWAVK